MPRHQTVPSGRVALVGRPNVGKSTIFNRLTGTRRAIVTSVAGTTRDVLARPVEWQRRVFTLVDTGGVVGASEDPMWEAVANRGRRAAGAVDLVVFVVDGREGPVPADEEVARELRVRGVPVVVAINKMDDHRARDRVPEFHRFGLFPFWGNQAIDPSTVVSALQSQELLDVLGNRIRVLDRFAVHVENIKGTVGTVDEVDRTEPVVSRRDKLDLLVGPPGNEGRARGGHGLAMHQVAANVSDERVATERSGVGVAGVDGDTGRGSEDPMANCSVRESRALVLGSETRRRVRTIRHGSAPLLRKTGAAAPPAAIERIADGGLRPGRRDR